MSAYNLLRHPWRMSPVVLAVLAAIFATGCGANLAPSSTGAEPSAHVASPTGSMTDPNQGEIVKTVVMDWTGGYAEITARRLDNADLDQLHTPDGDTIESYADEFQADVAARVGDILASLRPAGFEVVIGEAEDYPDDTVVYLTGSAVRGEALKVGQTKLDRCDLYADGTVVVWIGTVLKLGDEHDYDEWVNLLANITAHEVGHTVGFFHPDADEDAEFTAYEKNTEIMMAVHTLSSLLKRQEFIIPQETCPDTISEEYGGVAYVISPVSTSKQPALSYRIAEGEEEILID